MSKKRQPENSRNGSKPDRRLMAAAIDGLIGTQDPKRLATELGFDSVEKMLAGHGVDSLSDLFFSGDYLENMATLRIDLFRERERYTRVDRKKLRQLPS